MGLMDRYAMRSGSVRVRVVFEFRDGQGWRGADMGEQVILADDLDWEVRPLEEAVRLAVVGKLIRSGP